MQALKKLATPTTCVRREQAVMSLSAHDLVPGDIVLLEAGDLIPADLRLVEAVQLKADEAALTGESVPVDKHTDPLDDPKLPLGDRRNMAYKGTLMTYGRGIGVVIGTGLHTELGQIALLLHQDEEIKTPLQQRLAVFGRRLALVVLAICVVLFVVGVLRGEPPVLMFLTAVGAKARSNLPTGNEPSPAFHQTHSCVVLPSVTQSFTCWRSLPMRCNGRA
jgi:Ca2+-transporting ATPase